MVVVNTYKNSGPEILKKCVQEAQQWLGEPALVLSMWNSQNAKNTPRCKHCYNPAYGQSNTGDDICPYCYGTTYEGGIRAMWLCPIIVSNPEYTQLYDRRGQLAEQWINFQLPDYVEVWQNDFILRLNGWENVDNVTTDGQYLSMRPLISRGYQLDTPTPKYVKDGYGYLGTAQRVATIAQGAVINTEHPINNVCLAGVPIEAIDFSLDQPLPMQNQNGALYLPYVYNSQFLSKDGYVTPKTIETGKIGSIRNSQQLPNRQSDTDKPAVPKTVSNAGN